MLADQKRSNNLAALCALAAPPTSPFAAGSTEKWSEQEREHGIVLPDDYREYIDLYGAGAFYGCLAINSPFSERNNLWQYHWQYRDYFVSLQKQFPVFPEENGILAVGGDDNGDVLFWHTKGTPNTWSMVYTDFIDHVEYHCGIVEFLIGFCRETMAPPFYAEIRAAARGKPAFVPHCQ
jgi:SMI1-KNR4 cell-wall